MALRVKSGNFDDPGVVAMIEQHLERAHAETEPGSAHALDLSELMAETVQFWTVWDDDELVGMGALKQLDATHFELKSMFTLETRRRSGIGAHMVDFICRQAAEAGGRQISLETGSWAYFRPAVALYRDTGFVECAPFADYVEDPNSIFMTRSLD